jgi:uncharacterized membrane protein
MELWKIILFYLVLILIGTLLGYFSGKTEIDKVSYSFIGFVIGAILSLIFWFTFGIEMVDKQK